MPLGRKPQVHPHWTQEHVQRPQKTFFLRRVRWSCVSELGVLLCICPRWSTVSLSQVWWFLRLATCHRVEIIQLRSLAQPLSHLPAVLPGSARHSLVGLMLLLPTGQCIQKWTAPGKAESWYCWGCPDIAFHISCYFWIHLTSRPQSTYKHLPLPRWH